MTKDKTLTLTKQYQLYALIFFLFFLSNLLPLVWPIGLFQHLSEISFIAFFALFIFSSIFTKTEQQDELSKTNHLKANSFMFNASLISIMGILLFTRFFANIDNNIPLVPDILFTLIWFLLFSRNIAFLIYERMGKS